MELAYEELGNRERAKQIYAEAMDNYRDSFLYQKFRYHLGKNYWSEGNIDRAEFYLGKAIERTQDLVGNPEWRDRAKFLLASIENDRKGFQKKGLLKNVPPLRPAEANGGGDANKAGDAPKDDAPDTQKKTDDGDAPEPGTPEADEEPAEGAEKTGEDAKKEADDHAGHDHP